MRPLVLISIAGLCIFLLANTYLRPPTATASWISGWSKASALAKAGKIPVLANFTGSDWCGWCIKLKQEVFDTPEFSAWAKGKVVLLEVDFPQQTKLETALATENENLARSSNIEGFPTLLFLDAAGKELGRLNYIAGGPKAWIAEADKILSAKP